MDRLVLIVLKIVHQARQQWLKPAWKLPTLREEELAAILYGMTERIVFDACYFIRSGRPPGLDKSWATRQRTPDIVS